MAGIVFVHKLYVVSKVFIYLFIVQDLLKGLENLHHIGHAQLEFYILKHIIPH